MAMQDATPVLFERLEGRLLFAATLAAELNPGTAGSETHWTDQAWSAPADGRIYYMANDGVHGDELWSSDGTAAGTRLAADLTPGPGYTRTLPATTVGGLAFFSRLLPDYRYELWRTDGTPDGTFRVLGAADQPAAMARVGGRLYYVAAAGPGTYALRHTTDGADATTQTVLTANAPPAKLTAAGNQLLYTLGTTLWRYDEAAGHAVVRANTGFDQIVAAPAGGYAVVRRAGQSTADLLDLSTGTLASLTSAAYPTGFAALSGNRLAFAAGGAAWVTDGTYDGTVRLRTAQGPLVLNSGGAFGEWNGDLLFRAAESSGQQEKLWKLPAGGSRSSAVAFSEVAVGSFGDLVPTFQPFGGRLYFPGWDAAHGTELWETDGTTAGTRMAVEVNPFEASGVVGPLLVIGDRLLFPGQTARYGRELYAFDGTAAAPAGDANQVPAGATFSNFNWGVTPYQPASVVVGGHFFFAADDAATGTGTELWISDGTQGGTRQVSDLVPGNRGASPGGLTAFGGAAYFWTEKLPGLWRSDGTAAGTAAVPGPQTAGLIAVAGGRLYVGASNGLWVIDPDPGAAPREIRPGGRRLVNPWLPADVDGRLCFVADDGTTGREVWRTDGTDAGTVPLTDLSAGGVTLDPVAAVAARGRYVLLWPRTANFSLTL